MLELIAAVQKGDKPEELITLQLNETGPENQ
jgi:hypothetical protein